MKIETITYKRTKNLGSYQSETMEVMASLEEEDLPEDVADNLKLFVKNQLFPTDETSPPDSF
ncbi:MAG: hypothetical protein RMX35_29625 [Nostoc sp. DcaGUA01]|nr:hypothetical protein [Nostoc sp. DcaGUA01]